MNIREATKNDAPQIAKVHVEAWKAAYKEVMPKVFLKSLSVESKTKQWTESLSKKSIGTTSIIELNKTIVGFCVFGPIRDKDLTSENFGELVAINILPEFWDKGLGSKVLKYVKNMSYQRKWDSLHLWVIKENSRARYFYEKFGFELEGSERNSSNLTGHDLHEVKYIINLQ